MPWVPHADTDAATDPSRARAAAKRARRRTRESGSRRGRSARVIGGRTAYGTMPRPMPFTRTALLVLTVSLLAGCGSSPRTVRVPDGRASFVLDDFFISPQKVRVPPG